MKCIITTLLKKNLITFCSLLIMLSNTYANTPCHNVLESVAAKDYKDLGDTHLENRKFIDAIIAYDKAIELNQEYSEAFLNRSRVYMSIQRRSRALSDVYEVIRLSRGELLTDAIFMRNRIYDLPMFKDELSEHHLNNGNNHLGQRSYDVAKQEYNTVLEINPKNAAAFVGLGFVHFEKGKYTEAIKSFNEALRLKPNYPEALIGRSKVYAETGNTSLYIIDNIEARSSPNFEQALRATDLKVFDSINRWTGIDEALTPNEQNMSRRMK